jgi:hypothetical protein
VLLQSLGSPPSSWASKAIRPTPTPSKKTSFDITLKSKSF